MAELKPYRGNYYLWQYIPSTEAASVFAAFFILGTLYLIWKVVRTRAYFCIVFIIGGIFEIIGYCARAGAKNRTDVLMPYVIQSTLILIAPALFAASIYMVLGRVIRGVGAEYRSVIPVKWLTPIFVCGDIVSFVVQASGAGIMVTGDSMKTGENIILGGLIVQIVMFGLFIVIASIFHSRLRRWPTALFLENRTKWESIMAMLYTVSVFVFVRSIFRVIEYAMGQDGYPLKHEWTLYVFDAALMFGVVAAFAFRFPSGLVVDAAKDEETVGQELTNRNWASPTLVSS
ncbi:RTA1 like protein-domain-containing protein [Truncatella angustata]|uniref:RTA1 like protein-domain-containing protein n=1 Tax=Truncatella angustata TaxID=152316 RepID=A0A9P8RHC2_9PEZI|nr:RTA1 like protein-domain-containing protein [Truncatella angustata]KAH6638595.1 RTA1 like protein-domain-containing protein [Truncatella angustata]